MNGDREYALEIANHLGVKLYESGNQYHQVRVHLKGGPDYDSHLFGPGEKDEIWRMVLDELQRMEERYYDGPIYWGPWERVKSDRR